MARSHTFDLPAQVFLILPPCSINADPIPLSVKLTSFNRDPEANS